MILSVSERTDIVAYYTEWLIKRLKEGYCYVRNPFYPKLVYSLDLRPEKIDSIVFCSKNYKPLLKHLPWILQNYDILCFYTITAYEKDIEPNVPSIEESINTLISLSNIVGPNRVIWRFDPILLTKKYTIDKIMSTFEAILSKVHPYIQRIVFSFVEEYEKVKRNMPELVSITKEDKVQILKRLSAFQDRYHIRIQICGTKEDYSSYGILSSGCITDETLYEATKKHYKEIKHSSKRLGCGCLPVSDLGVYTSCGHGCKYCYANKTPKEGQQNMRYHYPNSPFLIGVAQEDDNIKEVNQASLINLQMNLFDL